MSVESLTQATKFSTSLQQKECLTFVHINTFVVGIAPLFCLWAPNNFIMHTFWWVLVLLLLALLLVTFLDKTLIM